MTLETINKRIESKTKEIEKLEKKLERIRKAEATNWEVNPYWYSDYDLRVTLKDIESAKASLAEYEEMLVKETEKANSRNIQVIIDFLNMWQDRVRSYYADSLSSYLEEHEELVKASDEHAKWYNETRFTITDRDERLRLIREKDKEYNDFRREFHQRWNWLIPYITRGDAIDYEKLNKDLQREADAKYDFIIERTNAITGTITDAANLRIGDKGDLNGFIIGERGTAKVQTIGAGGYNIQCFHFRTLINRMK